MGKISFVLSYMKLKFTVQWASHIMGELEAGNCTYKDWNKFHMQLPVAFRAPNKKEVAQQKLEQLR